MDFRRLFQHPAGLKNLGPEEIQQLCASNPNVRIVDVRTPGEFRQGHIEGALLAPLGQTTKVVKDWPRDTALVLVCHSGHRSQTAAHELIQLGFQDVSHLAGGMMSWVRRGAPYVRK
ncbi:MAG: rhodanese-like domain-containing protein [Thermaerobacter sp.]|nr:rhodanese-like domain-containing protein [Thermaerobacter sp.]